MNSNVVVREDNTGNIKPNKMNPASKIDGIIASVLAIARYLVHVEGSSVYEGRGMWSFG